MVFIGKRIFLNFINSIKIKDILIFRVNNKKKVINYNEINYDPLELRDIKIVILKYYLNKISLKKSIKEHLFNYLFNSSSVIHNKACLIKYLLDKKFNIDGISASFLSKSDLALFQKFNLRIKEIKTLKIKFMPKLSLISMFLYLRNRKIQCDKLIEYFSKKKPKFNPKMKYYTMIRVKNKHSEDIYLEKLNKSLDNTVLLITPFLNKLNFRQEKYLKYLKNNDRNYFFLIPKINYTKALKNAIKIHFSLFPFEFKISLFDIFIQRNKIDDLVKNINENFPDIREFYTDDNYNFGKTYLTKKLKESKIKVICYSHGVGLQNPLVNFDEFYVFSKMQRSYYLGTSKFKYYKIAISLKQKEDYSNKKLALFFVGQTLFSDTSLKLISTYEKVINFVERIIVDLKVPTYAKYHPGSTEKDKILSNKINIVDKIEDLPSDYNYLAVTLYSTYVVELLNHMPFMIINPQEKMNMKYYFPNNNSIYAITYQEFKDKINKLMKDTNYYFEYWNEIISQY